MPTLSLCHIKTSQREAFLPPPFPPLPPFTSSTAMLHYHQFSLPQLSTVSTHFLLPHTRKNRLPGRPHVATPAAAAVPAQAFSPPSSTSQNATSDHIHWMINPVDVARNPSATHILHCSHLPQVTQCHTTRQEILSRTLDGLLLSKVVIATQETVPSCLTSCFPPTPIPQVIHCHATFLSRVLDGLLLSKLFS